MNYFKLSPFSYEDNPTEQIVFFGRAPKSLFVHQLIEDTDMEHKPLADAVKETNTETASYADENGFSIETGEMCEICVCGNAFAICQQVMSLADGGRGVQQNLYFFDPDDGVFRMVQFGTMPLSAELWDKQGEALTEYSACAIRKILANMALPESAPKFALDRFVPAP